MHENKTVDKALYRELNLLGYYLDQYDAFDQYVSFTENLKTRAEQMKLSPLWGDANSFSYRNIQKTAADYEKLDEQLQVGINEGVMFLGNAFWTDWLLLLFAIYIGFMLFKWEHENNALNLVSSCVRGRGMLGIAKVVTALSLETVSYTHLDIPLAAVMHSPIGHFSSEELAIIRAEEPPSQCKHLYDAATSFAQKYSDPADAKNKEGYHELAGRLRTFFNQLETYRRKSRYLLLRELLVYVLEDSGYYEFISAMPGAATRKANLDMLLERAGAFEKTSYQGVFQFVRYINRLKKYSVDYASAQELAQNQVRVMSIHKSKGLEFPVRCV